MKKSRSGADPIGPITLFALVMMTLLVGGAFMLVGQFDTASRNREVLVVENGIQGRVEEVGQLIVPQVIWDDAVRHIDNRFDAAWVHENIAKFLYQADGFESAFILDARDEVQFASRKGDLSPLSDFSVFAPEALPLVHQVREEEAARAHEPGTTGALPRPLQASALAMVDGTLQLLTATLVQPDFGRATPRGPRAPVVVTSMPMADRFIGTIASRYMLQSPHLHEGDMAGERGEAHLVLRNSRGEGLATLDWIPLNPGSLLLKRLVAPVLTVVFILGIVALVLYRRGREATQELIVSEARATHLAYYDSLTGLPNRVLFFDRLGAALEQARRSNQVAAVHCIDLDRFKEVNDTYGHHVGDELIQEAARRMARQCRACDTLARLAGDEFAIVQLGATPASAAALADRIIGMLSEPVDVGAGRIFVGCSVGISMVSGDLDPAEALRQADLALYRAKQSGRGQLSFFEPEMDTAIRMRRAMEGELRTALAQGELKMCYQPQVNSRGLMTGVEALVRWRHPERGWVSPAFFVPVAEECGLIADLGMFTLRRAFEESRNWPGLRTAINVSANQVRMKDFVSRLADLVGEVGIDPRQFELEITEGILLGDDPQTHDTLTRLKTLGFSLALDDFGTGYSSLSYLQRYPISKIKIDRSFIANLGVDAESDAVVGAIVKLARALKLSVIAEGVETSGQRDRLAAAGCSDIQGYFYSMPLSAEEIANLVNVPLPWRIKVENPHAEAVPALASR